MSLNLSNFCFIAFWNQQELIFLSRFYYFHCWPILLVAIAVFFVVVVSLSSLVNFFLLLFIVNYSFGQTFLLLFINSFFTFCPSYCPQGSWDAYKWRLRHNKDTYHRDCLSYWEDNYMACSLSSADILLLLQ